MSWRRWAAFGAVKAFVPFQPSLRRVVRALSPYETIPDNDCGLLDNSIRQIAQLAALGIPMRDKAVVEIGTGWLPVLPLVYLLAGASSIVSVDQECLTDARLCSRAIEFVRTGFTQAITKTGADPGLFDLSRLPDSWPTPRITLMAPFDFNDLPSRSADVIVSMSVLEHVPEKLLVKMFLNMRHVLKPGGASCHGIDMSDHFVQVDKSISRVNFLRYEPWLWRLCCIHPQHFQNRLRRSEYVSLLKQNGFDPVIATGTPDGDSLATLRHLALSSRYRDWPAEELAILSTTIVAVPGP